MWFYPIRKRRIKKWQHHVNCYTRIAGNSPIGATRIKFVAGHLDILDRKFGFLLAFHALLATVYVNVALPHPVDHFPLPFQLFAKIWVVAIVLCLLGFAQAKWGDLGDPQNYAEAEKQHVNSLVKAVVTRSAGLRFCVFLTMAEILILVLAVRSEVPLVHREPKRIALIGPFSTGVACSTAPNLEKGIEDAASTIQNTDAIKLRIVGGTDAMPLGVRTLKEFGNNNGLALSRARCVEGWLTEILVIRNIHVDATAAVRDATDRSTIAEKNGKDTDRVVEVWATGHRQDDR